MRAAPETPSPAPSSSGQRPRALGFDESADRHIHRFHVETGSEPVMLSIGGPSRGGQDAQPAGDEGHKASPAPVPGGFAKFFNRVIDTGAWARLPDAARAVYLPLVRVADAQQNFRARAGVAALMRQTGLSRSSVKRGLKSLQEHRLITVVRAGGVAADGTNRTNLYQLLVPDIDDEPAPPPARHQTAARAKRGSRATPTPTTDKTGHQPRLPEQASPLGWFSLDSFGGNTIWLDDASQTESTLPGVQERTPSPSPREPPGPVTADTPAVGDGSPLGAPVGTGTGVGGEPLLRTSLSDTTSDAGAGARDVVAVAKQMLEEIGVAAAVAADLAQQHGADRIERVVTEAARRQRERRIRSAAGFAVRALAEGWEVEARPAGGGAALAERTAREQAEHARSARMAQAQREAEDATLDALGEQEWSALAQRVLERYGDHPAMIRLLTRQPARECRLMRAEVLALLKS